MIKKNKKKGILFWITGFSGAGKTSLANAIHKNIIKKFGPTIVVNGDDLRRIFKLKQYDRISRLKYSSMYCQFAKFIINQNINLIFTVVAMIDEPRVWNKKNIPNYVEIYVKANIKNIKKFKKKKIYSKKKQSIVGLQIKPQFPRKPNIIINNNFKNSIKELSKILIKKIMQL